MTMIGTSLTVRLSSITASPVTDTRYSLILAGFPVANFHLAADFPPVRHRVATPARSVASIMEASQMHFLRADARASVEASTAEEVSMVEEVTGEHGTRHAGKSTKGERNGL